MANEYKTGSFFLALDKQKFFLVLDCAQLWDTREIHEVINSLTSFIVSYFHKMTQNSLSFANYFSFSQLVSFDSETRTLVNVRLHVMFRYALIYILS